MLNRIVNRIAKTILAVAVMMFGIALSAATPPAAASILLSITATGREVEPQAAGSLDPSFGSDGKVLTDFFGDVDAGRDVVTQPDGKIVVVGSVRTSSSLDFGLVRYNPGGGLDASFGNGGIVSTDFFQRSDDPSAAALQQDGKILVAGGGGSLNPTTSFFAVARYNANGSLDISFGNGGKAIVDFGSTAGTFAQAISIEQDGKIVVAGAVDFGSSSSRIAVARLTADGALDTNFGNGGKMTSLAAGTFCLANGIVLQPGGKIVVSGYMGPTAAALDFMLIRYNSDGSVDPGFGTGGLVSTDFSGLNDAGRGVITLPGNKLLVFGNATFSQNDTRFAMACYNSDGSLDASFGTGGKVTSAFGGVALANAGALQPDGRIVLAGASRPNPSQSDFALARYNLDGSIDSSFGTNGWVTTEFFGFFDHAFGIASQPDGKIILAGEAQKLPGTLDFAIARYEASSASFSLGFGQSVITAERGGKAKVEILIDRSAGFTGAVTVTPPGATSVFKPKPPDAKSTIDNRIVFKLKVKTGAPTGPQQVTFVGRSDDGQVSMATVTLNIR